MRALALLLLLGCAAPTHWARGSEVIDPGARRIEIRLERHGFVPEELTLTAGETVTLAFRRTTPDECMRRVVLYLDTEHRIQRELPLGTEVAVTLQIERAGELGITCAKAGHGMTIHVKGRLAHPPTL